MTSATLNTKRITHGYASLLALGCFLLSSLSAAAEIQLINAEGESTSEGVVQIVGLDPSDPTQEIFNIEVNVPVGKRPKPAARRVTQVLNTNPVFSADFLAKRPIDDFSVVMIVQRAVMEYVLREDPPGQLPENPIILDQDYLVQEAEYRATTPDCVSPGFTMQLTITASDPQVDFTDAIGVYITDLVQTENFVVESPSVVSVDALLLTSLPPETQVMLGTVEMPPDDLGNPVYAAAFEVCVHPGVSTESVTWGRLKTMYR